MAKIKLIKDIANTNVKVEGIDVPPIGLNSFTCSVSAAEGLITIFNPNSPVSSGIPTKRIYEIPYTSFLKSDGSTPISAEDLKADIDLQLTQPATSEDSGYRGLWNPDTNTPDISSLDPAPEVGDFFFVSQSGTHDGVDYDINDRIQHNGTSFDRIPASDPWEYVSVDDSYDVTVLDNRNYVDYALVADKDLILPALSTADEGWSCVILQSSGNKRLRVDGDGNFKLLREGGSIRLLWVGDKYVILNYNKTNAILSPQDFSESAVNFSNTMFVVADSQGLEQDMDGTVLHPYADPQDAVDNASDGDTINLRGDYVDAKIVLPTDKDLYFYSEVGQTTFTFSTFDAANDTIIKQDQSNCYKKFRFENIDLSNAHGYAIDIESALDLEVVNCDLSDNGWDKEYVDKLSFIRNYTSTQSELQTFYASSEVGVGGAIRIKNTTIVSISQGNINYNKESIVLENCGIGGSVFVSRKQVVNNLQGVKIINCENVTGYNMAYAGNASNGLEVTGGINNRFALSVFQNNWGSDVVTDGVSNTKFRDNDLTNSNKASYNSDGTVSNNSPFLIKGMIARPDRKFLLEILDTQIHSTDTNTIGNSYKGIEFDSSLSNLAPGQNIINIDNVGIVGFHDQIHAGNVDATNLKIALGDYRNQEFSGSATVPPSVGYFYELPYSAHITKLVFPDFSLDGSATTVIVKDSLTGSIINPYPVNLIHVDVTTMNLMMGDKIQLENMDRANISVNGNLLNLSTDQATANTLNSMFERTEVGGGDVDPPMPTLTGVPEVLVDATNYNSSYMTLGLPDGNGNQTLISNQNGDNKGDVWSQIPMDQLGEFTQFQTDSAGGGKRFYVGFSRADQLSSLGDGSGNGHEGLQWSLAIYEGYNAPWTFYGDQATYSYSSFFGDKEAFRLHSGILTNKVTWKVGINENDGRFYVYFWSIIDLKWKYVAKTSYSLVDGDYHAVVRFYTQGGGMYGDFTNYRFPETDPVLTWNYIESPDGVFNYPLFATAEEANFADVQEGGAGDGSSHTHVFPDDTTNTTWYMPDSLMYHGEASAPSGNTLGSFTDIIWNEIATDVDSNYAPTPFSPQTIYVNEGESVNLQVAPADASFRTNIGGIPAFSLTNPNGVGLNYLQGTAPEVTGDNVSNPDDITTVTIYRTNDYGTSQGTLSIVINNLTPPVTVPSGFTLTYGSMADSNTLDTGSVLTLDDTLASGKRMVVSKSWVETNVLPNITGSLEKGYIGVPSPNANWNNAPDLHIDFDSVMRWEGQSSSAHKSTLADGSDITARSENQVGSATNAYYNYAIQWDGTDLVVMADVDESKINNDYDYTQMQRYSVYENYAEQSGNLPIVFATKSGGQMGVTMTGINFIDIPSNIVGDQLASQINYTPNYLFSSTWVNSSYENYSSGDTAFDTFGINQIAISDSFITIYFDNYTDMAAFRGNGNSLELIADNGTNPSWEGVYLLNISSEYSVDYSFNYVHYTPLSSSEQGNLAQFVSDGGQDTNVLDMEITSPPTIQTSWIKAIDFSGSNQHLKQVSSNNQVNAIRMGGYSQAVANNTDNTKTADSGWCMAWATTIVFKIDGNNSNQHIWNSGEGSGNNDDNIYLRLSANKNLYFGWGRGSDNNECEIASNISTTQWYGVYIAHKGGRFNNSNATASNLTDAFDIRLMSSSDSFTSIGNNLSTTTNWISTGNQTTRTVTGDFTIGGRGSNRSFHGKVSRMVVTTLKRNDTIPSDAEIKLMITNPEKWVADYKVGNDYRFPNTTSNYPNFQIGDTQPAQSTIDWPMGDGPSDAIMSNGIRNLIQSSDQNWTRLQGNSMASNDEETVNINGLS